MNRKKELINKFCNELHLRNYANNSIDSYAGYLSMFLNAMNGKGKVDIIQDIKTFLLCITNMNTRKMYIITIRNFYKYVLKIDLCLEDIPYPRSSNYLPQILSVQEVKKLLLCTNNIKHKAILQLMYSCALRIGEIPEIIANKKECHIDSNRRLLFVKNAKGFKDRYVPIPKDTISLLREYHTKYGVHNWLFMGQNQQKYTARSIQQIFKNAAQKAGISKKVTPHSLRHSRLTHLCEAGLDIYKLKEMAGHSNIKTTEIYLHLSKNSLVNNVEMFDLIIEKNLINKNILKDLAA